MKKEDIRKWFGNKYSEKIRSEITIFNPDYVAYLEDEILALYRHIEELKVIIKKNELNTRTIKEIQR